MKPRTNTFDDLVIRMAEQSDIDTIVDFQVAMALETEELQLDATTCRRGVESVMQNPALGRYWVAEAQGNVIASLMTTLEWSDWRAGSVWWIQSVYVTPSWRRKGVYSRLYRAVQDAARDDPGVRGVRLYVDRRNVSAQETYAALGMNGDHYVVYEWMKD